METDYQLEYQVFENQTSSPSQIWLAFHGIGQNTEAYKNFANQNNLKIYSFGLFYHEKNQSQFSRKREIDLAQWLRLMKDFLKNKNLESKKISINIIGFSLGVRPTLQFVKHFSDSVIFDKIILIAPETLAVSNWYRFGTQNLFGKFLLQKVVSSRKFKELIIFVSSFIFPKSAQKLIRYQIYHGISSLASAWLAYRPFEIDGNDWEAISKKNERKIMIVASENDAFVKLRHIQKFIRKNSFDKGKSIKWILSTSPHARLLREFHL
ncbi:hypothetical protein [Bernardetia sp.]|uniref:hypothetical protein n=1 Tax=Bernardetia sp. TaxID=1937974 RepID=UPI0025BDBF25|nr:hypothetical protein [Bernardetia sp.]